MDAVKKILAIAAALAVCAPLFGADARSSVFSRIKIELKLEKPPVPSVANDPRANPKVIGDPHWLVLRVTYHPQMSREDGPAAVAYLDGVKMSVRALFPLSRSEDIYGLFTGSQTFWTVCCDSKTHTAMMFIPPQILQRYMYMADGYTGTRPLQRGSIRVEVAFADRAGRSLGKAYHSVSGNVSKQEDNFERMAGGVSERFVIDGAFWEREATPWRSMAPDQFDLVAPAGVKIPEIPAPVRGSNNVRGPRRVTRTRSGGTQKTENK